MLACYLGVVNDAYEACMCMHTDVMSVDGRGETYGADNVEQMPIFVCVSMWIEHLIGFPENVARVNIKHNKHCSNPNLAIRIWHRNSYLFLLV